MADSIPKGIRVVPFHLLTESCITELSRYEQFITAPVELG
jgi:hypothetical protein